MKTLSAKLKPGFAPLLLIGIVMILGVVLGVVFGPVDISKLGLLSLRQQEQQSQAAALDTDGDGFSDAEENRLGTDPYDFCPDDANDAAWPPDLNNSKSVDTADIALLASKFGLAVPPEPQRYDLAPIGGDGFIDTADIALLAAHFGEVCYPYRMTASPQISKVTLSWTPGIEVNGHGLRVNDMTLSGRTVCDRSTAFDATDGYTLSSFLEIGRTSYDWLGWNVVPGHKYCAVLFRSNDNTPYSNFVEFTLGSHDMAVVARISSASFTWTPGLQTDNIGLDGNNMTISGRTVCDRATVFDTTTGGTDLPGFLGIGKTSYDWTSQNLIPGNKYCVVLVHNLANPASNFVEFTLGMYDLAAPSSTPTQVTFSWTPGVEASFTGIRINNMTVSGRTDCNWDTVFNNPTGTSTPEGNFGIGQTVYDWRGSEVIAGNRYCAAMTVNSTHAASNFVDFTVPVSGSESLQLQKRF